MLFIFQIGGKVLFHNTVNLLHFAGGGTHSGNKNDIQPGLCLHVRHKEAISLPYDSSGTVARVGLSDFCSGGYADAVYTEAVFGYIGNQNGTHRGFTVIKPSEIVIFCNGYNLSSQLLLPLFSFLPIKAKQKERSHRQPV